MSAQYTYSIINDFPNDVISADRLTKEIAESSILIHLEHISTFDDDCIFSFKTALSLSEIATLEAIIATHSGLPLFLPSQPQAVYIDVPKYEGQDTDEQKFLIGKLKTTSINEKIILSYEVPAGKTFHLMSYTIVCDGAANGCIKIGKAPLGELPDAPGSIMSNIFRSFHLKSNEKTNEVSMQPNPRKLANASDTVCVTVIPESKSATHWTATLDFILR